MLSKVKTLIDYKLQSLDGEIGRVKEFYFDDHHWTIRYLVADTGNWLAGRKVLISPYALIAVNREKQHITIDLFKKQIEDSPSLNSDKPVSHQFEDGYYGYYGWPMYWSGPYMWGLYPYIVRDRENLIKNTHGPKTWDHQLRSTHEVSGYYIHAKDGEIGHVEDFVIDDETWAIRYLIVGTRNWWPGKKVLVSPRWIERVSWSESKVFVNLRRETIQQSPEYTEESLLTRNYEIGLHQHYDRKGYWVDELADKTCRLAREGSGQIKSSTRKQKTQRHTCPSCREEFLSLISLRDHRQKNKGPHRRPPVREGKLPDIVGDIEANREGVSRGYHGYREVDRSS